MSLLFSIIRPSFRKASGHRFGICCLALLIILPCFLGAEAALAQGGGRSSEALSVQIRNRLYKTRNTFEVSAQMGGILNHPYITPLTPHASATYYVGPHLGLGLDFTYMINMNKSTRSCIELFYNTFNNPEVALPNCANEPWEVQGHLSNYADKDPAPTVGPAYPAILEPQMVVLANLVWMPIYGKLLLFMTKVMHFNIYANLGAGGAMIKLFPEKKFTKTGHPLRGEVPSKGSSTKYPGVSYAETSEYGTLGRPKPEQRMVPAGSLGVGQKIHLNQKISIHIEGRAFTLVGFYGNRVDIYYALWGGFGFRI